MKITGVDVIICKPNIMGKVVCVRVRTDEGIEGYGEVGLSYGRAYHAGIGSARDLAELVLGRDPFDTERIWEEIFRTTFWHLGGGVVVNAGLSAIDTALWDIKGKALGLPVWKLLGGRSRERIRAYASQLQFDWDETHKNLTEPKEYAAAVKKALAQGYTAIKVDPVGVTERGVWAREANDPDWQLRGKISSKLLQTARNRLAAMRQAGGEELDIIVELHAYTDAVTAVQLGEAIRDLNVYYYEEPVHPLNVKNMLAVREKLSLPIATGERLTTRFGFRPFLESGAVQVVQPDVNVAGGITETKKICDMANVYDASVQLHVCGGPIGTAASLQLEAVLPNFLIHEVHAGAIKPDMRALGKYDIQPVNGAYTLPEAAGIGQELSERALAEAEILTVGTQA